MNKFALLIAGTVALAACGDNAPKVSLDNDDQKAAYALGFRTGEQMQGRMDDIDLDSFLAGMRTGALGESDKALMDPETMDEVIMAFQQKKMEEEQAEMVREADENLAEGAAFRAADAEKEGVTVTDSGLQYEVLASGDGASPAATDTVVAHYHGTLIDGTVFDSSVDRGEPATFPLDRVIEGWQEALPMMKIGDKWRIVLPPHLAYGDQGAGGVIGPNATLIFEVELLDIVKE
ncbi:MAG: FKBP-type peptidyl-prolyl cis-trans isomerase [Alcanivoracaceae bacterium]|nr:FKBP-type peptidyl-prolyl cis-trans isomerase [Alcanivoracaceae bacterium]